SAMMGAAAPGGKRPPADPAAAASRSPPRSWGGVGEADGCGWSRRGGGGGSKRGSRFRKRPPMTGLRAFALATLLATAAAPALAQDGRAFTPEDLARLDRVASPQVSPDGRTVVYQVRATDWDANRGVNSLWRVPARG